MKRAEAHEGWAFGTYRDVTADDIDDVVRFLDLLLEGIPIAVHGTPWG
jgi:hypothetical protein